MLSTAFAGDYTFGVDVGEAKFTTEGQPDLTTKSLALNAGWLSESGFGFEVGFTPMTKSTDRTEVAVGSDILRTRIAHDIIILSASVVKEFALGEGFAVVGKVGMAELDIKADYRENLIEANGTNTQITDINMSDYSETAGYAFAGVSFKSDYSTFTVGVSAYKNDDVEIITPTFGASVRF